MVRTLGSPRHQVLGWGGVLDGLPEPPTDREHPAANGVPHIHRAVRQAAQAESDRLEEAGGAAGPGDHAGYGRPLLG